MFQFSKIMRRYLLLLLKFKSNNRWMMPHLLLKFRSNNSRINQHNLIRHSSQLTKKSKIASNLWKKRRLSRLTRRNNQAVASSAV